MSVAFPSSSAETAPRPVVIHAIGRLTDSVFRFVCPATEALTRAGAVQTVIAFEDLYNPKLADDFPASVRRVIVPWHWNPLVRWHRWVSAFRAASAGTDGGTVHLHGFVPSVMVVPLVPHRHRRMRFIYSPHGSRIQHGDGGLPRVLHHLLAKPWAARAPNAAMVSMHEDARALQAAGNPAVQVVESPVNDVFASVQREPHATPVVLGGTVDAPESTAARFTQLAVLMGNRERDLVFQWMGATDPQTMARLQAAEVDVIEAPSADHRAEAMATAWMFLAPTTSLKPAGQMVEAMVAGLPVVAIDCPQHRDLIEHGETGFLCADDREMVLRIRELAAEPDLCAQMGEQARLRAMGRFSSERFHDSILRAYSELATPGS